MLQPLFKLTDPYLSLFKDRIPFANSLDNSALPGIFFVEATALSLRMYAKKKFPLKEKMLENTTTNNKPLLL